MKRNERHSAEVLPLSLVFMVLSFTAVSQYYYLVFLTSTVFIERIAALSEFQDTSPDDDSSNESTSAEPLDLASVLSAFINNGTSASLVKEEDGASFTDDVVSSFSTSK